MTWKTFLAATRESPAFGSGALGGRAATCTAGRFAGGLQLPARWLGAALPPKSLEREMSETVKRWAVFEYGEYRRAWTTAAQACRDTWVLFNDEDDQ